MSNERLPKICFLRLVLLTNSPARESVYNWVAQFKRVLGETNCNCEDIWENLTPEYWRDKKATILSAFSGSLRANDQRRNSMSTSMQINIPRKSTDSFLTHFPERCPLHITRTILQIRLASIHGSRILLGKHAYRLDPTAICPICGGVDKESLLHILLECPIYSALRRRFLARYYVDNLPLEGNARILLNSGTLSVFTSIFYFLSNALKLRASLCDSD